MNKTEAINLARTMAIEGMKKPLTRDELNSSLDKLEGSVYSLYLRHLAENLLDAQEYMLDTEDTHCHPVSRYENCRASREATLSFLQEILEIENEVRNRPRKISDLEDTVNLCLQYGLRGFGAVAIAALLFT